MSKIVTVTEDDLKGDGLNSTDCPGFRAVKRIDPRITGFIFDYYYIEGGRVDVPEWVGDKLYSHVKYQRSYSSGVKAEPFSFEVNI